MKEIQSADGYTYRVGAVKASAAIRAAGIVGNLCGPSLVALGRRANFKEAMGFFLQADALGDNLARVCELLSTGTAVVAPDGKITKLGETFDVHFAGRGDALIPWLFEAAEVNLAPFFNGWVVLAKDLEATAAKLASKFQKLSEKNGLSGDSQSPSDSETPT